MKIHPETELARRDWLVGKVLIEAGLADQTRYSREKWHAKERKTSYKTTSNPMVIC
jgi:hypothetical protein